MNALDIVLVLVAVIYAVSGYQQGFLVGSMSTAGLLLGGYLGVELAPVALKRLSQGVALSVAALLIVIAAGFVGQAIGGYLGSHLRTRVVWRPARFADALAGAALSVAAMLLIAWVLGVAASGAPMGELNKEVRGSRILNAVNDVLPDHADRLLSAFNSLVDSTRFPQYLEPFATERITPVPAPSRGITRRAAVLSDRASVVKIVGRASCDRILEGSGFVFAHDKVMTNAHVVAGVTHPTVALGSVDYAAVVTYFDPRTDVAVLDVAGLKARPLRFGSALQSGDSAAVLGFPENGPYDVEAARIRNEQTLRSPDIYGNGSVDRDTYSIYSTVRQGNSGGPLVDKLGHVVGVVFAASVTDDSTGYALTAAEVRSAGSAGRHASEPVSTGGCST